MGKRRGKGQRRRGSPGAPQPSAPSNPILLFAASAEHLALDDPESGPEELLPAAPTLHGQAGNAPPAAGTGDAPPASAGDAGDAPPAPAPASSFSSLGSELDVLELLSTEPAAAEAKPFRGAEAEPSRHTSRSGSGGRRASLRNLLSLGRSGSGLGSGSSRGRGEAGEAAADGAPAGGEAPATSPGRALTKLLRSSIGRSSSAGSGQQAMVLGQAAVEQAEAEPAVPSTSSTGGQDGAASSRASSQPLAEPCSSRHSGVGLVGSADIIPTGSSSGSRHNAAGCVGRGPPADVCDSYLSPAMSRATSGLSAPGADSSGGSTSGTLPTAGKPAGSMATIFESPSAPAPAAADCHAPSAAHGLCRSPSRIPSPGPAVPVSPTRHVAAPANLAPVVPSGIPLVRQQPPAPPAAMHARPDSEGGAVAAVVASLTLAASFAVPGDFGPDDTPKRTRGAGPATKSRQHPTGPPSYLRPTISSMAGLSRESSAAGLGTSGASSVGAPSHSGSSATPMRVASVSSRLLAVPAHHKAALEERRRQQEARGRRPEPAAFTPKLTVVQEFRLATSRRAEWDASRASEDARLTTEERSAKKAKEEHQALLARLRAAQDGLGRAATPARRAEPHHFEPTVPAPFRLVSEARHERYQAELEEKVAAARRAEEEAAPTFKAATFDERIKAGLLAHRPAKAEQAPTRSQAPKLSTGDRVVAHLAHEAERWEHAEEVALAKQERQRAKAEREAAEAEALRRKHRFRASPVPDFSRVPEPDHSQKPPPTTPRPFKLETEGRDRSGGRLSRASQQSGRS